MKLPIVPFTYEPRVERERNRSLELADKQNRKVTSDVEIADNRLILKSPDGTRFSVTVDNAGNLSATSI